MIVLIGGVNSITSPYNYLILFSNFNALFFVAPKVAPKIFCCPFRQSADMPHRSGQTIPYRGDRHGPGGRRHGADVPGQDEPHPDQSAVTAMGAIVSVRAITAYFSTAAT